MLPHNVTGWWVSAVILVSCLGVACNLTTHPAPDVSSLQDQPLVLVLAPVNQSVFAEGAQVQLHAIAQDIAGMVARLEFRVDMVAVGEVTANDPGGQASLIGLVSWTATEPRKHLLTVEAFRPDGSSLGFQDVVLEVVPAP